MRLYPYFIEMKTPFAPLFHIIMRMSSKIIKINQRKIESTGKNVHTLNPIFISLSSHSTDLAILFLTLGDGGAGSRRTRSRAEAGRRAIRLAQDGRRAQPSLAGASAAPGRRARVWARKQARGRAAAGGAAVAELSRGSRVVGSR